MGVNGLTKVSQDISTEFVLESCKTAIIDVYNFVYDSPDLLSVVRNDLSKLKAYIKGALVKLRGLKFEKIYLVIDGVLLEMRQNAKKTFDDDTTNTERASKNNMVLPILISECVRDAVREFYREYMDVQVRVIYARGEADHAIVAYAKRENGAIVFSHDTVSDNKL